ncbi:MAG: type IV secretory system conjugative DNA transfer family protein, partial [Clostridia bacterium]|nr:type IV secretory system conjugative DNA transfer family protein [Clostridia bacterium]
MFVTNHFVFDFKITPELLIAKNTFLYGFELFAVFMVINIFNWYKGIGKNPKKLMQVKDGNQNEIYTGLEQAHFETQKEIETNFNTVSYDDLPNLDIEGIPIIAEEGKKDYKITFAKPAHTLIIGTTGSGKTTTFINPTVQILANTKGKPSMLISDPKGELYALHAKSLIKRGYDVKVLDLRNPYCSIRWNPLEKPYEMYQEMLSLEDKVVVNEEEGYYVFEDKIYYDVNEKNAAVQVRKQAIFDEVYEDLNDICSVLCPVKSKNEPIWESGAKNFILAITLAMLEDSEKPELGMTKEKFNFYNVMKIATNTQNDCEDLIEYFAGRSPISKSVSLSKQVLDASDKTRGSYLSTIFDKLSLFSDMSICSLTSANEIDLGEIATKPTALFLQIPDEKETRHTLAGMVILQTYKALVAKANTYPDLSLPRSVYLLLDEFGNLPQIHKLEQMITVGRSRRIWLALVVQSYAQLAKVYDDKSADIIKSNCNIQIFIGTTDLKTIDEFSKKCGNYSIIQKNVSFSSSNSGVGSSISVKERPLIYPTELQQLNSAKDMGNAIVNIFGFPPVKSKFTPSFKTRHFVLEKTNQLLSQGKYFNEEKVFYNMLERNEKVNDKKPKKK